MDRVTADFVASTQRAAQAGFDWLELHCAHGYLLSSFISPLTNKRTDEYGGSLENRLRYPLEVFAAVRAAWPKDLPMSVRISAHDWVEGGITPTDAVEIARAFKAAGADMIDCSSGQVSAQQKPTYGRMYQTPLPTASAKKRASPPSQWAPSLKPTTSTASGRRPRRPVRRGPPALGQPGLDADRSRTHWLQRHRLAACLRVGQAAARSWLCPRARPAGCDKGGLRWP
jgi:hypothetical protein